MRYRFVQDVHVDLSLHVLTVRSQRASASLAELSLPELPAGAIVLVSRDIPGSPDMEYLGMRMPILARDTVRYVGEPVALVGAPDPAVAQSVADGVSVRYAEPAPGAGPGPDPSPLRESIVFGEPPDELVRSDGPPAAELVTAPRRFAPPAPEEAVAIWEGPTMVLRTATQHPFHVRATVAAMLDLPAARIRVIAEPVDGPGGKLLMPSLVAAHAALVAFHTQMPARVRYSWREELGAAFRVPGTRSSWQLARNGVGGLAGARFRLAVEGGAYDLGAGGALRRAALALAGPYRWGSLHVEALHVPSGRVPCGLPPGCGDLEATCAREMCASAAASAEGIDPAQWRLRYLASENEGSPQAGRNAHGAPRRRPGLTAVIEEVVRASGFSRRYAAYEAVRERRGGSAPSVFPMRGVGLALATFASGFASLEERGARVRLVMNRDRRVTVHTSAVETGHGGARLFTRIVSDALGIPEAHVSVAATDTASVPYSGPVVASRTAAVIVPLLRRCSRALARRLGRGALPCSAESVVRGDAGEAGRQMSAAATVAAVEIDPASRALRCTGIWVAIDAGELLDPEQARSVATAALVRGLGIALCEEAEAALVPIPPASAVYATPAPTYRVARQDDVGELHVSFIERGRERGRPAPSGISELAMLGVPPAVASAVTQATGLPVTHLPIVLDGLHGDGGGAR